MEFSICAIRMKHARRNMQSYREIFMTYRRFSLCFLLLVAPLFLPFQAHALRADIYIAPDIQVLRQTAAMRMLEVLKAQMDGDSAKEKEAIAAAIAAYDSLIDAAPYDLPAHNARGIIKEQMGEGLGAEDLEFVIAHASKRIAVNAQDASSYHARATALRSLKRFEAARADYQEAIRLQPDNRKWGLDLRAMETEVPEE